MKQMGIMILTLTLATVLVLTGCSTPTAVTPETAESTETATVEPTAKSTVKATEAPADDPATDTAENTLMIAAAASLEYSIVDELIPLFQDTNPGVTVEGTYDSSGKLQTQIEEGLPADVFMSAAVKQMTALVDENLVDENSVISLLENEIVLIAPADSDTGIVSFADIVNAGTIALGDPESVPAGQYAQEALESLGVYDEIAAKASFGTNVTEVLNWVAEGSADVGIVYTTDAATTDKVKILAIAPEGSLAEKVIYPVGIVSASGNKDLAQAWIDFLQTPEAVAIFESYGFKSVA